MKRHSLDGWRRRSRRGPACFGGGLVLIGAMVSSGAEPHPISGPENTQLPPGIGISLFAREPDVVDPVALAFDEFGDAYVLEMRDYPYGLGPEHRIGGAVKLLRDTDGDGKVDRVTVFAEGLSFPTSVASWNGGVLVTAPPDVLFLKDTDGDGRADVREVVLTGFRLSVTDSNANGLRWGLDNRVHGANGGNGGQLSSPKQPGIPAVKLGNRDFRFHPGMGRVELTTDTGGGFGLVFDDWGRSFVPYNIDHQLQRVANSDRFAGLVGHPPFRTTHSISDHGEMARIHPIAEARTRLNHPEQAGYFSAAGGMGYLGHLGWPGDLPGSVFVGDVVGNLFHRDVLVPDGPIFRATRAPSELQSEFFASRDPSFRPVGLELGPDGALYLIDMQRDVIEHPDYIPARLRDKLDLRAGEDRGRIYRIAPRGWTHRRELPGRLEPQDWVGMLSSSNQWARVTAQRLLVTRSAGTMAPRLAAMVRDRAMPDSTTRALGRLHALWTLAGLGVLEESVLLAALDDPHPGVRENAVQVAAEGQPSRSAGSSLLRRKLVERLADADAKVRFHAALAMVGGSDPSIGAMAEMLVRDARAPWSRRAVFAAVGGRVGELLDAILLKPEFLRVEDALRTELLRELAAVGVAGEAGTIPRLVRRAAASDVPRTLRLALLEGLSDGLERTGAKGVVGTEGLGGVLAGLEHGADRPLQAACWRLGRWFHVPEGPERRKALADAAADAARPGLGVEARNEALRMLALGDFRDVGPTLFGVLQGVEPAALQLTAFATLKQFRGREAEIGPGLVKAWPSLSPSLRLLVVDALVYVHGFHDALLGALESGAIQVGELNLDLEHRRQLMRKAAPAIRARAAKFMSDEEYSNRKEIVEAWLAKLPPRGEATKGQIAFEKLCSPCHRSGGLGFPVGPDLHGLGHRSVEDLLSNILDPNMAMNPSFVAYTAELTDGESETGILVGDTPAGIVLVQAGNRRVELPRSRIRQLRSGGRSPMPEGLEAGLSPQELRDVIAFIQEPAPSTGGTP